MYKETLNEKTENLEKAVAIRTGEWKKTYHLPYAPNGDKSWFLVPEEEFKLKMLGEVRAKFQKRVTKANDGTMNSELTTEEINYRVGIVHEVLKSLSKDTIRHQSEVEWLILFNKATKVAGVAEDLTTSVMQALATESAGSSPDGISRIRRLHLAAPADLIQEQIEAVAKDLESGVTGAVQTTAEELGL